MVKLDDMEMNDSVDDGNEIISASVYTILQMVKGERISVHKDRKELRWEGKIEEKSFELSIKLGRRKS